MKAYVEHLSAELTQRYLIYLETFIVDLWSDDGQVEFRVGYSLRADHRLRSFTVSVDAQSANNDVGRRAIIAAIFVEIEDQIDDAIAAAAEIVAN